MKKILLFLALATMTVACTKTEATPTPTPELQNDPIVGRWLHISRSTQTGTNPEVTTLVTGCAAKSTNTYMPNSAKPTGGGGKTITYTGTNCDIEKSTGFDWGNLGNGKYEILYQSEQWIVDVTFFEPQKMKHVTIDGNVKVTNIYQKQ